MRQVGDTAKKKKKKMRENSTAKFKSIRFTILQFTVNLRVSLLIKLMNRLRVDLNNRMSHGTYSV